MKVAVDTRVRCLSTWTSKYTRLAAVPNLAAPQTDWSVPGCFNHPYECDGNRMRVCRARPHHCLVTPSSGGGGALVKHAGKGQV